MITTPRLTILMMVAMTIMGTSGPVAAFTQAAKEQQQQQQEEEEEQQVQDQQEQGDNPPNPT
jgi:ribosomal protein L12E/L44/L45/RPP1/RPP2